MNFKADSVTSAWQERLNAFMETHIYPVEKAYRKFVFDHPWREFPGLVELQEKARSEGIWNIFLPKDYKPYSPGLTNLQYAPLAEIMGRVLWSSKVFNCAAPDTGNMEVLAKYGSVDQKTRWLDPLLNAEIRSAFLMTEPQVASSDATNIETSIVRDGDHYRINGRKWWSTGAYHPACKLLIVMGKTDPNAHRHLQQSMILVPIDTPGVTIIRPLQVFGSLHSPEGHCEIDLKDVLVPVDHLILGEGRGFEIAQGRLGPGRIHHCMRLIGCAQRALEMMCQRVVTRETFGKRLADYGSIRQQIARSRSEIAQARYLTLAAADAIDTKGIKGAKDLIAMIKIVCPRMTEKVIDRAIQAFGGMGVSEDTPLSEMWEYARFIRLADGPDEVHEYQLGRNTIRLYNDQ